MKSNIRVLALFILLLVVVVPFVGASPPELPTFQSPPPIPTEVPPLPNVIAKLATGFGVGAILSFLFRQFAWFKNLSTKVKWWIVFLTSVLLPLFAQIALQFVPAEVWVALEPYWQSIALGFLTWIGSQVVHLLTKNA